VTSLDQTDRDFLQRAIATSRHALEDQGKTPFGAVVVLENEIIGEGTSSVIELLDPSAHAEIMALRDAATKRQGHLIENGTLYSSSEPCPMCLTACYWARISRIVFGATSYDVATYGFEDLQLYHELSQTTEQRSLREDAADRDLRDQARNVLRAWAEQLPEPAAPKY
jgi:guanine deaminase